MSRLFHDGFETYDTVSRMTTRGWTIAGTPSLVGTAKTGARAFQGDTSWGGHWNLPAADEHATLIAGVGFNPGNGSAAVDILRFTSDTRATTHVAVSRLTDGNLRITAGGAVRATTTNAPLASGNAQYYVEAKAVLSDSVGSVDVWLNNGSTPVLTYSGDTKNGGTKTVFDSVGLIGANTEAKWDDLYVNNGAGSVGNDRDGEVRVWPLAPNANGNSSQLVGSDGNSTDNYLLVDEAASSLNTADYVGSSTDGQKDTYGYSNLTPTTGQVLAVNVASYAAKTDSGARSFRPVIRHASVDNPGTDQGLSTSVLLYVERFLTNPGTAAAWTIADVNGAEFGIEVRP